MTTMFSHLWAEPQQAALGTVRRFLHACDTYPRNRNALRKLAREAHTALRRVEEAYFIDEKNPHPWEHP